MLNYIQDIDTTPNKEVKDATVSYKKKQSSNSNFSTILNNLNSKSEKTKTNFVDKVARKTNTSSINQKVLQQNSKEVKEIKDGSKKLEDDEKNIKDFFKKDVKKALKKAQTEEKTENTENNSVNSSNNNIQQTTALKEPAEATEKTSGQTDSAINNATNDTRKDIQSTVEKLSDINDNSSVKPSPLFLEEEANDTVEKKLGDNEVISLIETVSIGNGEQPQPQNKETTSLDKIAQELAQTQDLEGIVEEISESLDDFNLSQQNKEDIQQAFDKIKTIKENNSLNITADFEDTTEEIKKVLVDLNEKLADTDLSNDTKPIFSFGNDEKELISADYQKEFKTTNQPEIKEAKIALSDNQPEIKEKNTDTNINSNQQVEYDDEIEVDDDVIFGDEKVKLKDKIAIDKPESSKVNPEIISLLKENNSDDIKIDDNIIAQNQIENKDNVKDNTVVSDDKKVETKTEIKTEAKTEAKADSGILKESDNTVVNKNEEKTTETTQEANKENTENSNNILASNNLNSNSGNQTPFNENSEPKEQQNNNTQQKNVKVESDFKNTLSEKEFKDDSVNDEIAEDIDIQEDNIQESKLYAKVEQNTDIKQEENLEKLAFQEEKLNDMILSISKESYTTGALTVADEVAKIAINETSALEPNINISYNGQNNILLNNFQSTIKPQETLLSQMQSKLEQSDILNQITEKFQQIKDGVNQKLTMVLRPNDLGRLSIELINGLKGLTTNIVVQNEHVRNFIEKNINSLRNQLASAGVNVNQIQIKTAGTGESTTYNGNPEQENKEGNLYQEQQNKEQQNHNKKQFSKENLLASLTNFDTSFADDFSNVLNKTINYSLNK